MYAGKINIAISPPFTLLPSIIPNEVKIKKFIATPKIFPKEILTRPSKKKYFLSGKAKSKNTEPNMAPNVPPYKLPKAAEDVQSIQVLLRSFATSG